MAYITFFGGFSDSWFQAGFVLTTGVNSVFVLGYSGTIMVPLGWIGGVVGLLLATLVSLYANMLLAKLHEVGGKKHIRYRDLAAEIYGMNISKRKMVESLSFNYNVLTIFFLCCLIERRFSTGRKAYSITWALQYVNLFMINIGFLILGGSALKVIPE